MVSERGTLGFTTPPSNEQPELEGAPGDWLVHYTYDALGRLIRKQTPIRDGTVGGANEQLAVRSERYFYDGARRIQEVVTDPIVIGDPGGPSGCVHDDHGVGTSSSGGDGGRAASRNPPVYFEGERRFRVASIHSSRPELAATSRGVVGLTLIVSGVYYCGYACFGFRALRVSPILGTRRLNVSRSKPHTGARATRGRSSRGMRRAWARTSARAGTRRPRTCMGWRWVCVSMRRAADPAARARPRRTLRDTGPKALRLWWDVASGVTQWKEEKWAIQDSNL
ncbi:MAG: hypothetical protein KF902_06695 [Phycisphaeraceae bacterium]|nr:hypothetical protein [Phycisphaeraceae bacterium]